MDHVGIDIAKVNSQICILEESGEIIERRIQTSKAGFARVLASRAPARVLLEASCESEWIARCIEELGHEVIVADPSYRIMYGARGAGVKTDRRDASALAQACRVGAFRPAHRLSEPQRRVRRRIVVRDQLVRTRSKLVVLVRALLRQEGIHLRSGAASSLPARVREAELPGHLLSTIAPLLASLLTLNRQIEYCDEIVSELAKEDARAINLCTVPGVGPLTAVAFVNSVDEAKRFESAHKFEAFIGLVPSEYSSGESSRRGHITKAGNKRIRILLVEAAIRIRRLKSPKAEQLWRWADKIADRRGKRIANVALARRLAGVMFAMLRDGSPYRAPAVTLG